MNKKITIWKVLLVLVILVVLAAGSAIIFRAGYVKGAAANIPFPEWEGKEIPFDKHHFYKTPFGWRSMHYRAFPMMFPGLFCFGGLFFFLIFTGLGIYLNRRWVYRKHGPNDPWHFWSPPSDDKTTEGTSSKDPPEDG
jgi:hypothetical protein